MADNKRICLLLILLIVLITIITRHETSKLDIADSKRDNVGSDFSIRDVPPNQIISGTRNQNTATKPLLVLGILSGDGHLLRREIQRETVLQHIRQFSQDIPYDVKYKFIMDKETEQTALENKLHSDIIYVNASTHGWGQHFGYKVQFWFKYVFEKYPNVSVAVRMDDDAFMCVPQMLTRIYILDTPTLYYGWKFGSDNMTIATPNRVDEMFMVLGRELIKRLSKRKYCPGTDCDSRNDLVEHNFGDTSMATWLSIYKDVNFQADNKLIFHSIMWNHRYLKHDFCKENLMYHKARYHWFRYLSRYNYKHNPFSSKPEVETEDLLTDELAPRTYPYITKFQGRTIIGRNITTGHYCSQWAVTATARRPTPALIAMSKHPNWCLVIVAYGSFEFTIEDLNMLRSRKKSETNVIYLTLDQQNQLFPLLSDHIPTNSFSRKNIGYAYAIKHGASSIWDFNDDCDGVFDQEKFKLNFKEPCFINGDILNPYPYFGAVNSWPRGISVENIKLNNETSLKMCKSYEETKIVIFQSLLNHHPDVDGMFQLTRNFTFDFKKSEDIYVVPKTVYAPFNSYATLWRSIVFRLLLLPTSVSERVSDIWRSYISQFHLKQNGIGQIAFVSPFGQRNKMKHEPLADYKAEQDLYMKTKKLVSLFFGDSGDTSMLNFKTLEEVYLGLYVRKYIEIEDLYLLLAWQYTIDELQGKRKKQQFNPARMYL